MASNRYSRPALPAVGQLGCLIERMERRVLLTTAYDTSGSFSTDINPNGVWTFGSLATLTSDSSTLIKYTVEAGIGPGMTDEKWTSRDTVQPSVFDNLSDATHVEADGGTTITRVPQVVGLHPGPSGEYSVVRFTAPSAGTAAVTFAFAGIDSEPTTTDVHVLYNGVSRADGDINVAGGGNTYRGSLSLDVAAGDTIDFVVGKGNDSYLYDSTSLVGQITLATDTSGSTSPLTPTITRSTLPSAAVSGSKLKNSATLKLYNGSTVTANGRNAISLYATTTGAIDAASTLLASVNKNVNLAPGKSAVVSIRAKPVVLPAGNYSILARVTDAAGGVSTSAAGGTVTVAPANVALSAAVTSATVAGGRTVVVGVSVSNGGNVDATGVATINLGLSTDRSTVAIAAAPVRKPLRVKAADGTKVLRLKVAVPRGTSAGVYYPLVTVALAGQTVTAVAASPVSVG